MHCSSETKFCGLENAMSAYCPATHAAFARMCPIGFWNSGSTCATWRRVTTRTNHVRGPSATSAGAAPPVARAPPRPATRAQHGHTASVKNRRESRIFEWRDGLISPGSLKIMRKGCVIVEKVRASENHLYGPFYSVHVEPYWQREACSDRGSEISHTSMLSRADLYGSVTLSLSASDPMASRAPSFCADIIGRCSGGVALNLRDRGGRKRGQRVGGEE
eukprot:1196096-Prorocentrum_minimum.AAC.1